MTLDELKGKLPPEYQPVVEQYGPALVKMTAAELWAWIDLLAKGDVYAAYKQLLEAKGTEALSEWAVLKADWQAANAENAAKMALQRTAAMAVLKVALTAALATVGL